MATTTKTSTVSDEIVSVEEIVKAPRGRKANHDPELVKVLGSLEAGQAVVLRRMFGEVPDKNKRPNINSKIKGAWKAAGRTDKPTINYSPEGVPQVSVKVEKAS